MVARYTALLLSCFLTTAVFAQPPNIRVSNPQAKTPEEITISINPTNPLNLAAGANLRFYYYSMDGGLTWTQGLLTSSMNVWGDPSVTFDADGDLYYAHLSWPGVVPGDWLDRIVVQKSTDGGMTYDDGVGVGLNPPKDQDKEWITADLTNSPYRNNLYLAWTEFDDLTSPTLSDSTRILFSRSTDHSATWSAPVRVSELGGLCFDDDDTVEGAVPAVGPNGEVYLSWSGHNLIFFDKSLDGGVTWGTDVIAATQPGGWNFDVPGIFRCNGFPVTMCDVSNSSYRGHVYILFSDQRNGTDDTDVFLVKSTDGGVTWTSPPIRVNDDTGTAQQFFCWGTIDPGNGEIYVVFYDRRNTTGNATEVYVARSRDGGATFGNFRVSETPFTPTSDVFFGDYIGIAALNGRVYPIWTRMDGSALSVWVAPFDVPSGVGVASRPANKGVELQQNYPNPFNPVTTIEFELLQRRHVSIGIYTVDGVLVKTIVDQPFGPGPHDVAWDGRNRLGESVSSGVYFYTLRAGMHSVTKKMTLLK
jgi:hypothetical protein